MNHCCLFPRFVGTFRSLPDYCRMAVLSTEQPPPVENAPQNGDEDNEMLSSFYCSCEFATLLWLPFRSGESLFETFPFSPCSVHFPIYVAQMRGVKNALCVQGLDF